MGNKESQFNGRSDDIKTSQVLDSNFVKSFVELSDEDDNLGWEKFQIISILTNIRQYRLLSGLYDKALRIAKKDDNFFGQQLSLSLICDNRYSRATKMLQKCILQKEEEENNQNKFDESLISEYLHLARLQIEQLGDLELAESATLKAITLSSGTWLSGRCHLLLAMIFGLKAQYGNSLCSKKDLIAESIKYYEKAIELDPHDDTAHLYCALEYANSRDFERAKEYCQAALSLNTENPFAIMLLALIFTARKDYKGALELVINALNDFPSHYGLLVLRLKLEARYGRVEEALQTSHNLICFWRKNRSATDSLPCDDEQNSRLNGDINRMTTSREAIVPLTPLLIAPLGITATPGPSTHLIASNVEGTPYPSIDNLSTIGPPTNTSDGGGPASTDSLSVLSSSSKSWINFSVFRLQADIWVELAEFFIEIERMNDVQACVEEACMIYPNSYQALYLKGHLYFKRAEKCAQTDPNLSKKLMAEAKNFVLGAISICTEHVLSIACLGRIYHFEGYLKMAEKMFRDATSIEPYDARNWHQLGCVLSELGRSNEALECFETASSLEVNTPLIPFQVIPRLLSFF
uniref:TPR_REGION domain-containing protein n=3 Tax=Meloidogyne TaxID=189290 RepID=A0A914KZZ3_MELIC